MASNSPKACLIIFARYPAAGKVKTRLIPAVGAEAAAVIYREMAELTLHQARSLAELRPVAIQVWFTGGNQAALESWLGSDVTYHAQPEGDLGDRLAHAFRTAFDQGHTAALAIGTDCPSLSTTLLNQGFEALQHHDLVLGPATDGGYYLIGLQRPIPELFQGIAWSTASVLQQTKAIAAELSLTHYPLPPLTDVDTPEDLDIWERIKITLNP